LRMRKSFFIVMSPVDKFGLSFSIVANLINEKVTPPRPTRGCK
jgi:hypothetical protein